MKIRIAITDDNHFLTRALCEKLSLFESIEVKYTAINGKDILDKVVADPNIDLILMDIEMPLMNGIKATFEIKNRFPQIKIIMLTVFDNDELIFNAIRAGADGYLLKEISSEELYKAIEDTMEGGAAMTPSIALKALKLLRNPVEFQAPEEELDIQLTTRETEVLEQLGKGLNHMAIAENLFISPKTVRKHIENIYRKLQVHNKLEAVQKAQRHNLI